MAWHMMPLSSVQVPTLPCLPRNLRNLDQHFVNLYPNRGKNYLFLLLLNILSIQIGTWGSEGRRAHTCQQRKSFRPILYKIYGIKTYIIYISICHSVRKNGLTQKKLMVDYYSVLTLLATALSSNFLKCFLP